jgi:hypothetical protein
MWVNGQSSTRRWVMLGATTSGLCAALMIAVFVIYPRVGEGKIGDELAQVGRRIGRDVRAEHVDVGFGWARIRGLVVAGPDDGAAPLLRVEQIYVKFRGWRSMMGSVSIDRVDVTGVAVHVRRDARGEDNVSDAMARLRGEPGSGSGGGGRSRKLRPKLARLAQMRVAFEDEGAGVRAQVGDISGQWIQGDLSGVIRDVVATAATGQAMRLGSITIKKGRATRALIELAAGELALWPKMSLSGISGTVIPEEGATGRYRLSVDGGYGGVAGKLWKALGEIDVGRGTASLDVAADKFNLDRLEPILKQSYLVDYAQTSVDANLRVDLDRQQVTFSGGLHVRDLSVGHPMLADREVRHLDVEGTVAGTVLRAERVARLVRGDFVARGLPFSVTGEVAMRGGLEAPGYVPPVVATSARSSKAAAREAAAAAVRDSLEAEPENEAGPADRGARRGPAVPGAGRPGRARQRPAPYDHGRSLAWIVRQT